MTQKKSGSKASQRATSGRTPTPKKGAGRVQLVKVPKPWGHEIIWAKSDRYVGKILHINAGEELSVQYHNRKDETIYLLSGEMAYRVQGSDDKLDDVRLNVGESFRNTPGTIHQMIAVTDCDVLEVSTPELDDVVRLSDKYGREGTSAP
jgi:mannose-6-phosphate isomerase